MDEVIINGEVYVLKGSGSQHKYCDTNDMRYVIVRTRDAGVFAGYLKEKDGDEVVMVSVRRLWYWSGASSLSQLAMEGVKRPGECKFPCELDEVRLLGAIEIIRCTEPARKNISEVPVWEQ